jgi:glycosyltransferase involved in cell wall biosynthesis
MTEGSRIQANPQGIALSVVISTWNRRNLVWQAIDSVIGQQYEGPLEIVVVDDGSTDGTMEELSAGYAARTLPSNRHLIIHSNPHTGITGTMGKGIELSSGDYVTMCNSDDLWEPSRAAELLAEVERTPNTLIHTACKIRMLDGFRLPGGSEYRTFTETDDPVGLCDFTPVEYPGNITLRELLLDQSRSAFYIRGCMTIFPRKFMQGEFAMPAGLIVEEIWFIFAAMMQGSIRYANCNSYVQRMHGQNDSMIKGTGGMELEKRLRCNLVFLVHAIPILRNHAKRDVTLLRRVATRARVLKYRLDVNSGSGLREALRGVSLSDFLVGPRELLSYTLRAKAPSFHGFLQRMRQGLSRSSHEQ